VETTNGGNDLFGRGVPKLGDSKHEMPQPSGKPPAVPTPPPLPANQAGRTSAPWHTGREFP
jgi:hypothetical protein